MELRAGDVHVLEGRHYQLAEFVNGGAFGEVWFGHEADGADRIPVILKFSRLKAGPDDESEGVQRARLAQEGRIAKLVRGCLYLVDARAHGWLDRQQACYLLVMDPDWAGAGPRPAESLWAWGHVGDRSSRRTLTPRELAAIAHDAARGLAFLHEKGYLHRDVKTANLLVLEGEPLRVKVTDYGQAMQIQRHGNTGPRTEHYTPPLTLQYMPPEVVEAVRSGRGAVLFGESTDVYSLGVVLWELLFGLPHSGGGVAPQNPSWSTTAEEFARVFPSRPPLPTSLTSLIDAMLARSPADRPTAAQAAECAANVVTEVAAQRREAAPGPSGADAVRIAPATLPPQPTAAGLEAPVTVPPTNEATRRDAVGGLPGGARGWIVVALIGGSAAAGWLLGRPDRVVPGPAPESTIAGDALAQRVPASVAGPATADASPATAAAATSATASAAAPTSVAAAPTAVSASPTDAPGTASAPATPPVLAVTASPGSDVAREDAIGGAQRDRAGGARPAPGRSGAHSRGQPESETLARKETDAGPAAAASEPVAPASEPAAEPHGFEAKRLEFIEGHDAKRRSLLQGHDEARRALIGEPPP